MEYFAVLATATLLIGVLAFAVFRKSRDAGTLVGTAALYYWSLFGAWYVVIDKTGGFSGKHYQYLEKKMFPIALDVDYMTAILLYTLFIVGMQLTLLVVLPEPRRRPLPRLILRHEPVLIAGFAAAIGSMLLMRDELGSAWALNQSAYWYTRTQTDSWFTLHQVLNRAAMLPSAIGFATLLAGKRSRYFVSVRRRYTLAAYVVLLGGMGMFTFVLGNKNEVLAALIAGVLTYLGSVARPSWGRVGLSLAAGAWFLYAIDFFRATPVSELPYILSARIGETTGVATFMTSSNEAYAAHFSMYGVLSRDVPPRFGYSIYSLACSAIPRALWPNRPRDIYLYYSESVGTVQNQGYSLHHATGWFLNFGHAGVLLGGVVLALVWGSCIGAWKHIRRRTGIPFRLFATISPWLFAACLPPLIRAGPEGYKGFLIEGALIPVAVLLFSCRPKKRKKTAQRLQWDAARGWGFSGV